MNDQPPTQDRIRQYRDALRRILALPGIVPGEEIMKGHELMLTWVLDGEAEVDQLATLSINMAKGLPEANP